MLEENLDQDIDKIIGKQELGKMDSIQQLNGLEIRASTMDHVKNTEIQTFDEIRQKSEAESPLVSHHINFETQGTPFSQRQPYDVKSGGGLTPMG